MNIRGMWPVSIEQELSRAHHFQNLPLEAVMEMPKEQLISMLHSSYQALQKLSRGE